MHVLFGKNTCIVVHVILRIRMHKIKLCEICLLYFEINLNSKNDCIVCRNIFSFLPDLGLTTLWLITGNLMFVDIILSESNTK